MIIKVTEIEMNFAIMKISVGDFVKNQVVKSEIPRTKIAAKMGISRTWLNSVLDSPEMDEKHIISIGRIIKYDFSKDFPQLNPAIVDFIETEINSLSECQKKVQELTEKYLNLHEKYTALLEKQSLA